MPELKANIRIAQQIEKMMASDRMGHAFLFVGGTGSSREEIGTWLSYKILCRDELSERKFLHGNHEDFLCVSKPDDKESIVVSLMEELTEKLRFKPFGNTYAVLIKDANLMNAAAQNKLLKTLEEPESQAVIILLSDRLDAILPTVRSRCNVYVLEDGRNSSSPDAESAAENFIQLIKSKAPYYRKKTVLSYIINDKDESRQRALEFIDILEEMLEKELLAEGSDAELLGNAVRQAEAGRRCLKQVHSVAYTLKQMCLRV